MAERLGLVASLKLAFTSKRLAVAIFLMFASGMPLGLVWIAIPVWMKEIGVDIRLVGLFTLAQAPWSFKFLWSPLVERYEPFVVGGRRGYILLAQIGLAIGCVLLALSSDHQDRVFVIAALCIAIAIVSATQDIALDAYTVDVLRDEEHGLAVGARTFMYRMGMNLAGPYAITLASWWGWKAVNVVLALSYLPCLLLTLWADEPRRTEKGAPTFAAAVLEPLRSLASRPRALEILAFVVFFKLADNLAQSLQRPFFVEMGFGGLDVGFVTGTISSLAIGAGSILGGLLTNSIGLGRALWTTGVLQALSNLGYAWVAKAGAVSPVLYAATAFEYLTSGLGTGAFGVLLLRLTEKRFSATQYALLSSLFTLPRIFSGPPTGVLVDAIGWFNFFVLTVTFSIPGMVLLARFVPWGVREPVFTIDPATAAPPLLDRGRLLRRSLLLVPAVSIASVAALGGLEATKIFRASGLFPLAAESLKILLPGTIAAALSLAGALATGLVVGVGLATLSLVSDRGPARGESRSAT
jgi:PAT family beta-lactamase induction signal transducer AmpG